MPSWNSLSFWARKSNCRISRGKPQRKTCSDHVPERGGSPVLAPWRPDWSWRLSHGLGDLGTGSEEAWT